MSEIELNKRDQLFPEIHIESPNQRNSMNDNNSAPVNHLSEETKRNDYLDPYHAENKKMKEEPKDDNFLKSLTFERNEQKYKKIETFIESKAFQIPINILIIYVLFADDFRTAFLPKSVE